MADDPTLQGCCRKDLQQQARAAEIKTSLLAVDPSQAKQKLQQQVISTQPYKEDFDSNSDAGLEALRRLRLQQLQGEAQLHSGLQAAGRGAVISVADDQLLACEQLDDHLDTLAHRYLGTAFLRTRLSRHSRLPAVLGLPPAPALLIMRARSLIGKAPLHAFGDSDSIFEEQASDSEWQEPCEICGRRYFHEHIRAVYAADGDGDLEGDQD
eukprot:jgi/Astpho2/4050/Aster-x0618